MQRTRWSAIPHLAAALLVMLGLGGCGSGTKRSVMAPRSDVDVIASEYQFAAPESIDAGLITFHVTNPGSVIHQMVVYQLLPGARLDSTLAVLRANARRPDHVLKRGGVEFIAPRDTQVVTMALAPGEYVLLCGLPVVNSSATHLALGMLRPLRVVAAAGWSAAAHPDSLPLADNTLRLVEYDFAFDKPLHAGTQTVRVEDDGQQQHNWLLARVAPGTTIAQIDAFNGKGPEPWTNVGGAGVLDPGQAMLATIRLPAGWYMHSCMVADAKDHKPHFMHGMEKIAEVK